MATDRADPFAILGLDHRASREDLRRAYRALALVHHPDRPSGDAGRFREVADAFASAEASVRARARARHGAFVVAKAPTPPVAEAVHLTPREYLCGGHRDVTTHHPCPACNGTGAHDPEDFIVCLSCRGTGRPPLGQRTPCPCPSCGGEGGCDVSRSMRRCATCLGSRTTPSSTRVLLPAGASDGQELGRFPCLFLASHRDLARPTELPWPSGGDSVFVSSVFSVADRTVRITLPITLGQVLCGFETELRVFGEVVPLRQLAYDPDIARPSRLFSRAAFQGFVVDVYLLVTYPDAGAIDPFRPLLDRILNGRP